MAKLHAYLTLYCKNPETNNLEILIGQKIFLNEKDGYIASNPHQYAFPGGGVKIKEESYKAAIREFKEETSYNINDFDPIQIINIYQNRWADFFIVEIPYKNKQLFQYSKQQITKMKKLYEFEFFEWVNKEELLFKLNYKPNLTIMVNRYINFLKKNRKILPVWLSRSDKYKINCFKNMQLYSYNFKFKKILENHIRIRSYNDWFIECYNCILVI